MFKHWVLCLEERTMAWVGSAPDDWLQSAQLPNPRSQL